MVATMDTREGAGALLLGSRWKAECFDHVAIPVSDLAVYKSVLQMEDFVPHDTFGGPDLAFLRNGGAALALLKLPSGEGALRGSRAQKGHFALRVDGTTFWTLHAEMPALLARHRAHPRQSTATLCDDFAVQLSMFFFDPDGNEVEIATWDCARDDSCSRFGGISDLSIRGDHDHAASASKL